MEKLSKAPAFKVGIAGEEHLRLAERISEEMEASAKVRGTGIARRAPAFIEEKIREGKAVIALTRDGEWAGFCYIQAWQNEEFVANSGLIVAPKFRKYGLAKTIKARIFELSRKKFPKAKIFGLTTARAVMKINSGLGYEPVTYPDITTDPSFWQGCQSCVNHPILMEKKGKNCLCTAMVYDPEAHPSATRQVVSTVSRMLGLSPSASSTKKQPTQTNGKS